MEGIMSRSIAPRRTKKTESLGLLFFVLALFLILCLASYDAWDTSFDVESSKTSYSNYIGRIGAHSADLLYQCLGLSAFLLVIPLFSLGYWTWKGQLGWNIFSKLLGLSLMLLSMATFLEIFQLRPFFEANFNPGGVIGLLFYRFLSENFNYQGALILVIALFFFSLILATSISLSGIFQWLFSLPASLFRSTIGRMFTAKPAKAAAASTAAAAKLKSKTPPREIAKEPIPIQRKASAPTSGRMATDLPAKAVSTSLEEREAFKSIPVVLPANPPSAAGAVADGPEPSIQETAFSSAPSKSASSGAGKAEKPRWSLHSVPMPSTDFLEKAPAKTGINETALMEMARKLQEKCAEFGALGRVTQIHPGPIVTTFEFQPDTGIKYSRVVNLVDDLCLGMQAESIRIDRIPGKSTVGIEVPNPERDTIFFREIVESEDFQKAKSKLTLVLGKTIHGDPYVTDLAKMPHLLVAGATGAGKSVGINTMITSILYKAGPEDVKFILVDPKRLELGMYADIPHLLTPIVTEPKRASSVLAWAVTEMELRYKRMARYGVRNIDQYNQWLKSAPKDSSSKGEMGDEPLPFIVIVIDELADLMMTAGREVEDSITRLAQMARAVGIHLILATQRPSVDVITGLIKANFPCRLSFRVSQKIDSRTIIDSNGAEKLLGNGDMLFLPPGTSRLWRIHGAYISEKETQRITDFLRNQAKPLYNEAIEEHCEKDAAIVEGMAMDEEEDPLYEEAMRLVVEQQQAATSLLQRRLKVGYGRAARLLDMMERDGIVGPPNGSKGREILKPADYRQEIDNRLQ